MVLLLLPGGGIGGAVRVPCTRMLMVVMLFGCLAAHGGKSARGDRVAAEGDRLLGLWLGGRLLCLKLTIGFGLAQLGGSDAGGAALLGFGREHLSGERLVVCDGCDPVNQLYDTWAALGINLLNSEIMRRYTKWE